MNCVTDTHALLWWFTDSPKISPKATEIFEQCEKGDNIIFIPSIVIAETLSIFDKKRISFDFKKLFKKINESENRGSGETGKREKWENRFSDSY